MRLLRRSPVQTFLLVPLAAVAWEWALGTLHVELVFLPLMIWGYLQYRICGRYRIRLGAWSIPASTRTIWFHFRVPRDERGLTERFGEPYVQYKKRVRRWF